MRPLWWVARKFFRIWRALFPERAAKWVAEKRVAYAAIPDDLVFLDGLEHGLSPREMAQRLSGTEVLTDKEGE